MFGTLLAKEIRQSIRSARFGVCFAVLFLLMIGVAATVGESYVDKKQQAHTDQIERNRLLDTKAHTNRIWNLLSPVRPPGKMEVLFNSEGIDVLATSFFENPVFLLHRKCDLSEILIYLIGIIAIILSYDAVCGERENGTLRMLSAFSVPRISLLLAKLTAGLIVMSVSLVFSVAVAAAYLLLTGRLDWTLLEWAVVFSVLAAGIVHFTCYYAVGLFASTVTSRSTSSALVAFLTWTFFLFIVPSVSPFLAAQLYSVPGVEKTNTEMDYIRNQERDELVRKFLGEVDDIFARDHSEHMATIRSAQNDALQRLLQEDSVLERVYLLRERAMDSAIRYANEIQRDKAEKISDDLERRLERQFAIAKGISSLSPSANLAFVLEGLAVVGKVGREYFLAQANEYFQQFYHNYYVQRVAETKENNPLHDFEAYLDIRDRPEFVYREMPFTRRWALTWMNVAFMLAFAFVFLLIAHIAFQRYDVR